MLRFAVAMNGSTQTQILEVEYLLRNFNAVHNTSEQPIPARSSWSLAGRPVIAACFAIFVCAPGCAAAAVFLMRADGTVPPITNPDINPPFATKSDRLPIEQWSAEAVANLGPADETRIATATANADPAFLSPVLIRGSLEDGTLTTFAEPATTSESNLTPPKPRLKHDVRRSKPPKLVTDITPPEPPQPTFFEKLFGPRLH